MADAHRTAPAPVSDGAWRETIAAWGWKRVAGGDWELSGTCPTCSHLIFVTYRPRLSEANPHSPGAVQIQCRGCARQGAIPFARLYVSDM
jgi:hypothetical protein